jgi:hypothetical protein
MFAGRIASGSIFQQHHLSSTLSPYPQRLYDDDSASFGTTDTGVAGDIQGRVIVLDSGVCMKQSTTSLIDDKADWK